MSPENDPISDVIALLRPHTVIAASLYASGPWAIRFESYPHVKFGCIARGGCWLTIGNAKPVWLREGDLFLLGNPPPYCVSSTPAVVKPRTAKAVWARASGHAVQLGPVDDHSTWICGGHFTFDDPNARLLLDVLPTFVHVRADEPQGQVLSQLGTLLGNEARAGAPGSSLVLDRLAQVVLVYMLRAHASRDTRPAGWLGALGDARIGASLRAMHADVARRWTLEELAAIASMSRSAFAASFKSQVGSTPLDYLIQWRMSLARDALRHERTTIGALAFAIGYESESAFSSAFRRVVGQSPKQWREAARAVVPPAA